MAAPPLNVLEMKSYMERAVELLTNWLWLFKTRPIDTLKERLLDSHAHLLRPLCSLNVEELNQVPFGFIKEEWPEELKHFILESHALTLNPKESSEEFKMNGKPKKMNPKKLHETSRLAPFVARVCSEHSASAVIDIGAGLGYVDRAICELMPDSLIIAVECDSVRCDTADQTNLQAGLETQITQLNLSISAENIDDVCNKLGSLCADRAVCLVALHACGDLTVNCFKIFQKLESIKCAVLVSCCYHRMNTSLEHENASFPMSRCLKEVIPSIEFKSSAVNLLRVAAETTRDSWTNRSSDDHQFHSNNVFFRGLIEIFITENNLKSVRANIPHVQTWEKYADSWLDKVYPKLDNCHLDREEMATKLQDLFTANSNSYRVVTPFNCLHNCLQGVAENLVIVDRLMGLVEKGVANVDVVTIFDRKISPRCNAFVLSKHETS